GSLDDAFPISHYECEGCHEDGAETQPCGLNSCLDDVTAIGVTVFGELDNQNGVLGRQPDHCHHPHLEIHVVRHSERGYQPHSAQHAQRHHQHHRKRNGPAFVQCRQHHEHYQHGQ